MKFFHVMYIAKGISTTLFFAAISLIFGLILGTALALCLAGPNKFLEKIAGAYVSILRGTPMLLQLSLVYFALPTLLGIKISAVIAGVVTFSLNSASYIGEILKGGIKGVPVGQFLVCATLKIPYFHMMKDIVLPQALKSVFPALVNEATTLIKETALISIIGKADIMRRANIVSAETFNYFMPLLVAAACYYLIIFVVEMIAKSFEKGFGYDKN
ncbi:amino acid ABC transporter permease [Candidatus Dependentiae bacterium]